MFTRPAPSNFATRNALERGGAHLNVNNGNGYMYVYVRTYNNFFAEIYKENDNRGNTILAVVFQYDLSARVSPSRSCSSFNAFAKLSAFSLAFFNWPAVTLSYVRPLPLRV